MTGVPETTPRAPRHQWLWLVLLVLLAMLIRWGYAWHHYGDIAQDGVLYSSMARGFRSGDWAQAFNPRGTPLFPALMALVLTFTPDVELAGLIVSGLFSALSVAAAFLLGQVLGGRRVAWWAAIFVAFSQMLSHYGAEVLTEGTYTFWLTLTVATGAMLLARASFGRALAFGVVAGIAYLVRQEVLMFVALTVVAVIAAAPLKLVQAGGGGLARRLGGAALASLVFLAVAGAQVVPLYAVTGRARLFSKASWRPPMSAELQTRYQQYKWELAPDGEHVNLEVTDTDPRVRANLPRSAASPQTWLRSWWSNLGRYFKQVPKMVGFAAAPLLAVVWLLYRRTPRPGLLLYVGGLLAVWFCAAGTVFTVRRYMAPLIPTLAACAALGVEAVAESAVPLLQRAGGRRRQLNPRRLSLVLGVVVATGLAAQTVYGLARERRTPEEYVDREIGLWMAGHLPPATLLAGSIRCGLYAGFPTVPLPRAVTYEELLHYARARKVTYFLVTLPAYEQENPALWSRLKQDPTWQRVHSWPRPGTGTGSETVLLRRRPGAEPERQGGDLEPGRPGSSRPTGGVRQ